MSGEEDLNKLSRVVALALGTQAKVVEFKALEGDGRGANANAGNHHKAILEDGKTFGVKSALRVKEGTTREFLVARTADLLSLPGTGNYTTFSMLKGMPLEEKQVVMLEWVPNSKPLKELGDPSSKRSSPETALQVGQWFWLCLFFKVGDRHLGNWVWSENHEIFAMIDNEDWREKEELNKLPNVASAVLGNSITLSQAKKILEGLRWSYHQFLENRSLIVEELNNFDASLNWGFLERDLTDLACYITQHDRASFLE